MKQAGEWGHGQQAQPDLTLSNRLPWRSTTTPYTYSSPSVVRCQTQLQAELVTVNMQVLERWMYEERIRSECGGRKDTDGIN